MAAQVKALTFVILSVSLLSLEASSLSARRSLIEPAAGGAVFYVTTFGAVPDGAKDCTQAMMQAWAAACKSTSPAKLVFPAGKFLSGEVIFQGPCAAPITIEITGDLISSSDLSAFTQGIWINVDTVDGVTVTGTGTLDGMGPDVWPQAAKNGGDSLLPNTLQFTKVTNGVLENIKVLNSKGFHTKVTGSSDVQVRNMQITAPGDSPNTDGLHISTSTNVNVTDMVIGTGDDCISIGEGNTNINVLNVKCGPGHGISIGSLGKRMTEKDVKGVLVKNCSLTGTTNGARIKTFHASPPIVASGIIFEDITMDSVKNPIIIDQHYSSKDIPGQSKVQVMDVHFRNFKGTTISPEAVTLNCSTEVPCKDVELANINLTPAAGVAALTSLCDAVQPMVTAVTSISMDGCHGGPAAAGPPAAPGAEAPAADKPAPGAEAPAADDKPADKPAPGGDKPAPKAGGQ